ncbi:MAG: sigma-54 dependent transcriptional regulator [Alphaproteobacteria bacterium]|nr:sigma-54 dependent transcriptional regulator [Alphaproteobacteria bacterium]
MAHDVLVVDDEQDIRELIAGILSDEGYEVRSAATGLEALDQIQLRQPHIVILDVWLGDSDRDGLNILSQIKRDHPYVPVIMISGHATIETAVTAIKNGAYDFIEKPFQSERLLILIQRAIEASLLKRENADMTQKYVGQNLNLIGTSSYVHKLSQHIDKLANNNWRVFITGPKGTMKEDLAKEIHKKSARHNKPYIIFNCEQYAPHQIEVALFGTDIPEQDGKRIIGCIEQAHQGTLFFHQITALPLPIQAKLTKVLIDDHFSRIGSSERIPVNVRFMAGTSEDINTLIKQGDFREDLFFRLNVFNLNILPLKSHIEDLETIVRALCDQFCAREGAPTRYFSPEALIYLQRHPWSKNFRELKNIVERALINAQDTERGPIPFDMLPALMKQQEQDMSSLASKSEIVTLPIKEAREIFEREYLQSQVTRFSGNITKTAQFIGMERSALHRKLKALNIVDQEHVS